MDPGLLNLIFILVVDTLFSWSRMFIALGLSILISLALGIYAARSDAAEKVIIPIVDILQTLPILTFFPFVILIFVGVLPGFVGVNAAVVFLIVTSMVWNIIFGVYESVKTLPKEFIELAELYHMKLTERLEKIFIPASMPRVVEQSILSWSIGLFYLVTSEIFSTGNQNICVHHGVGVALSVLAKTPISCSVPLSLVDLPPSLSSIGYALGISVFILFVILTRFLFFKPLENYVTRYTRPVRLTDSRTLYQRMISQFRFFRYVPGGRALKNTRVRLLNRERRTESRPDTIIAKREYNLKPLRYALITILLLAAAYLLASNGNIAKSEYSVAYALLFTFGRVWLAFGAALAVALPVCVYMIFITKRSGTYLLLFQIVASIPATILLPAMVAVLKNYTYGGELVAFVVFFLSGIWYIIFSTMNATKTLPRSIFEVKKVFGVRGWNAWKSMYIKAILPGLITGGITAIAAEWNASIVAEYFGTTHVGIGIGRLLDTLLANNQLLLMFLAILNLVVMILLINTFVWKRLYRNVSRVYG